MRALIRLIAALLCLVLAAVGALFIAEAAWFLAFPNDDFLLVAWPSIRADLAGIAWNGTPVRISGAVMVVAGLVLLVLVARARRGEIRLHDPAPQVTVTTDPKSLARLIGHQVRLQEDVAKASVTARRNRVRVRARAEIVDTGDLDTRLSELATETVRELPLPAVPKVSVSVRPAKERR
ncbi:hypothetical protein FHX42_003085 [Saccharopolyspora lacisalsi]|uniref:DUF6286 domain-containing protein n=1 Tax=Halosaccharopolyspora lacisalsi TaxID=1000566 RepID=A0A839DYB5_9PSEU|nr:DUF6286 domain-containing protein [Halosaccharopolyspora lacisalsi]MBA8825719.1 hypothetical protein [Halosaccharopolyspora lacisalsi]